MLFISAAISATIYMKLGWQHPYYQRSKIIRKDKRKITLECKNWLILIAKFLCPFDQMNIFTYLNANNSVLGKNWTAF